MTAPPPPPPPLRWDYTDLARFYDNRPDYAPVALSRMLAVMQLEGGARVADIGAGTGKLTVPLLRAGYVVSAVEPNAAMRRLGIGNTAGQPVVWHDSTGTDTGLETAGHAAAFFGSSFGVMDQDKALAEVVRICRPRAWFACMWNHRDLDDPIQWRIEEVIKANIPGYSYGVRRQSPEPQISGSGLFGTVQRLEYYFCVDMDRDTVIEAWKSHATLARQAGDRFADILSKIATILPRTSRIRVPYFTRIWMAQIRN